MKLWIVSLALLGMFATLTMAWTTPLVVPRVMRTTSSSSSSTTSSTQLFWRPFGSKTDKTKVKEVVEEEVTPVVEEEEKEEVKAEFMDEVQLESETKDNNNDAKAKMANLMAPIKEAGVAGAVSLFLWEAAFWIISIPAAGIAYYQTTGSWPDWQNAEDGTLFGPLVALLLLVVFCDT